MSERARVSARPPLMTTKEKEIEFINEGVIEPSSLLPIEYPWENKNVRSDVIKLFNVRLSEPDFLKLKYLSEHKKESINSICVSLIKDFIDNELGLCSK